MQSSGPVEVNAQELIAPEAVESIPEIEFDQTANLTAEAGHDRLVLVPVPVPVPVRVLVRMQSRSRNWSLIRQWVGNSAL